MRLWQQLRSVVIHGLRLAFFLPVDRNAFDVSYVATAIVIVLIGSVWAGLYLSLISANGESAWQYALTELLRPGVFSVAVAGLGRALSRRLPFRMLLATLAGTMPAPDAAELLLERVTRYLEVSLTEAPWPGGLTSALFGYSWLAILHLSLIAWVVLILYRSVRLIAGSPAAGLTLSIIATIFAIGLIASSLIN